MANEEHHLTPDELEKRAWELMKSIQFALFTSWDGQKQAQWPLSATPDRDSGTVDFLVSIKGGKYDHLDEFPAVTLGFADPGGPKYVVVNGHATLSNDRARIKELWSPFAKAWPDSGWTNEPSQARSARAQETSSEDDPDIRLLTVTAEQAELWDSPGKLIATAIMLTAAVTGAKPAVGDHGAVRL